MAISTATVPGALFASLINGGTENVRYMSVGKTLIMWDDKDVKLIEDDALSSIGFDIQFTTAPKKSRFSHSVSRHDLAESIGKKVKGGVTVLTIGKFMLIRDAKKNA